MAVKMGKDNPQRYVEGCDPFVREVAKAICGDREVSAEAQAAAKPMCKWAHIQWENEP
jgi:hypothetical protein